MMPLQLHHKIDPGEKKKKKKNQDLKISIKNHTIFPQKKRSFLNKKKQ